MDTSSLTPGTLPLEEQASSRVRNAEVSARVLMSLGLQETKVPGLDDSNRHFKDIRRSDSTPECPPSLKWKSTRKGFKDTMSYPNQVLEDNTDALVHAGQKSIKYVPRNLDWDGINLIL